MVQGRKNWPPRSHLPSLVSYRLDHIHWKSVCSSLWTQGYWKRWTAPNDLLLRADTPHLWGTGTRVAFRQGSGPAHSRTMSTLSILFHDHQVSKQKGSRRELNLDPSACQQADERRKSGPEHQRSLQEPEAPTQGPHSPLLMLVQHKAGSLTQ